MVGCSTAHVHRQRLTEILLGVSGWPFSLSLLCVSVCVCGDSFEWTHASIHRCQRGDGRTVPANREIDMVRTVCPPCRVCVGGYVSMDRQTDRQTRVRVSDCTDDVTNHTLQHRHHITPYTINEQLQ
mmetsp:Transcript_34523/g.85559  ORF Transcript_34523/g.85559 Transcript_34523/m.85559 type:complete len:127 (-) Transcript_34523:1350-1730(-)